MPTVLMYGDSHITHLEEWSQIPPEQHVFFGPTPLDTRVLTNAYYCAVGGSRFDTVHDRVCGINVPSHQKPRGNQWYYITEELNLKPDTVLISLG